MKYLQRYVRYLLDHKLDELNEKQLDILLSMDIPILKFISINREQMLENGRKNLSELLEAFEKGTAMDIIDKSLENWEKGNIEGGIPREAIHPSDLILIYTGQEKALIQFIPDYTDKAGEAIHLVNLLSDFYMKAEEKAFAVLFRIRQEIESALQESEEKFRSMSQSAADGIVLTNEKMKIFYWNKAAEKMLGYSAEEVEQKKLNAFFKTDGRDLNSLIEMLAGKEQHLNVTQEFEMLGKDKKGIPTEISLSTYLTPKGRFFVFIIHDIRLRKYAEEQLNQKTDDLERSNKALEQFAYVASHDMREPLRMITSFLQLLQRKYASGLNEEAQSFIKIALDGAKRMGELITDLLNYSRLNASQLELKNVDMNAVLQEVKTNLAQVLEERDVKLTAPEMPVLKADHVKMVQLFQNLIANGIKFNDKQPEIRITAKEQSNQFLFRISDNGIGMSPEQISEAFIMFKRLHGREYPGTGIGLALCKRIVEQHKGNIWVESTPEEGTTFNFTIKKY